MNVDLNKYRRACIPAIKAMLVSNKEIPRLDLIGIIAVSINCPIIAVGHFIQEIEGPTKEMSDKINRDIVFYKINEVLGKL